MHMPQHFRRYLLINSGIILASFLVCGLLYYFAAQLLSGKKEQIVTDRTAITRRSLEQENLSQLKAGAAEAETLQNDLNALLPTQDGLIGFPQFMNTMARNHSLGLTFNFAAAPAAPGAGVAGTVSFFATLQGSADNIARFIDDVENKSTRYTVA